MYSCHMQDGSVHQEKFGNIVVKISRTDVTNFSRIHVGVEGELVLAGEVRIRLAGKGELILAGEDGLIPAGEGGLVPVNEGGLVVESILSRM